MFIGSSGEGLPVASTLQVLLDYDAEVEVWNQGAFEPGGTTLASLVQSARSFDFAVLIVTPDDTTQSRGKTRNVARDNVLFELGLFMGALGKERVYMLHDRVDPPDLPSDLAGVTPVTYALHKSGNLRSSLGAASTELKEVFERLGLREAKRTEVELSQPSPPSQRRGMVEPSLGSASSPQSGSPRAKTIEAVDSSLSTNSASGGESGAHDGAVAAVLERLEHHSRSRFPRQLHDDLLASGWKPSTPAKTPYIRWTYSGQSQVSMFQNSAYLVAASNQLVGVVVNLPGAEYRMPRNEVNFGYLNGIEAAINAANAVQEYANRSS